METNLNQELDQASKEEAKNSQQVLDSKEETTKIKKFKRISRLDLIIKHYSEGITDSNELGKIIKQAELDGKVRIRIKEGQKPRTDNDYKGTANWYISLAHKRNLITKVKKQG